MAPCSALGDRLLDWNLPLDIPPVPADFPGHGQHLGSEILGERRLDPLPALIVSAAGEIKFAG